MDWESREGVLLSDGLRLSPAAQRFAIARELWHVRGSQVWQDGGLGASALFGTYLLGRSLNRKLGFAERPRVSWAELVRGLGGRDFSLPNISCYHLH